MGNLPGYYAALRMLSISAVLFATAAFAQTQTFNPPFLDESIDHLAASSNRGGNETSPQLIAQSYFFETTAHEYAPTGYVRRPHDAGPEMPVLFLKNSTRRASTSVLFHSDTANKTLLQWGGRVHLDMPIDLDPIGNPADFVTSSIPVPQQSGGNTNFSARPSRLQFKTQSDTEVGTVTSFAQWDFFDSDSQGPTGSYQPRLRLFYFDVGKFRIGQAASVFMDYSAYPNVIDSEGPSSLILIRQALIQMTVPLGNSWNVAVAAEQPYTDVTLPIDMSGNPDGNRLQEIPDFTTHLRHDNIYGHVQTSGVVRRLTFEFPSQDQRSTTGYGINLTGDLHLWSLMRGSSPVPDCNPKPIDKCRFTGQFATGYGISRYLQDTNGLGLDAAIDVNGELDALFARGWYVGYEQWWTNQLSSTLVVGEHANSSTSTLPGNTYVGSSYVASNLIWNYSEKGWIGFEYLWGQRRDLNSEQAEANRLLLGIRHTF